jgi:carbonic anhydrase/acetyltransferase-like protein (isoleucine patch superfamily)
MEKKRMETAGIQRMNNELKLFPFNKFYPIIAKNAFLAAGVKIIGNVEIGEYSSVWYNTVIRGDVHYIKIGSLTNIQDCSMLHVTSNKNPLNIGSKVTAGHSVNLHGCTINDLCLIGIGAIILDGAVLEENSIVAAGSVVTPGFVVPKGKLAAGVPAKIVRDITETEINEIEDLAFRYKKYSEETIESLNSSPYVF